MSSVDVTTSERAVVGHIVEAAGMLSSLTSVGSRRFDPVM